MDLSSHGLSSTVSDEVDGARTDNSVTRVLAIDCEMVGVGPGKISALARVSIVNMLGNVVYDKYVRPTEKVTDFRTRWSGIRPCDLITAEEFFTAQKEVSEILKNRLVVGHAVHNDLKALLLTHPPKDIRDTQIGPRRSSLKHLADLHLGIQIQQGEHDSVEDARTALRLYLLFQDGWEKMARQGKLPKAIKSSVGRDRYEKRIAGLKRLLAEKADVCSKIPPEDTRVGRNKHRRLYSKKTSRVE